MRAFIPKLLVVLCLVALAALQVSGVSRGYVCLCDGHALATASTHCHLESDGTKHACDDNDADHDADADGRSAHALLTEQAQFALLPALVVPAVTSVALPPNSFISMRPHTHSEVGRIP